MIHAHISSFRRAAGGVLLIALSGCYSTSTTDRDVAAAIEARQRQALDYEQRAPIEESQPDDARPDKGAYDYAPHPSDTNVPPEFEGATGPTAASSQTARASAARIGAPAAAAPAASRPAQFRPRGEMFTLIDSLVYAQKHRREYQTGKEDLYLVALALSLERHLWTPQFAAELRTIYGNYGEATDFDQAMRFVADLSMAQRLPYGGEFTARAVSTLIRDVKKSITAAEGSVAEFGLNVPFLRGAGHVAREELIQLERDLTYAVRDFERFRRAQLVLVAQAYFDLLRVKQDAIDSVASYKRFQSDFDRAKALEDAGTGSQLDTRRAEQEMLTAENNVADLREQFRAQTDIFKLLIGMPVDEPLGIEDLEEIDQIDAAIAAGTYPLLQKPAAAENEELALAFATKYRLDLLNREDQIDDSKRGVAVAQNRLLADLNWNTTLALPTESDKSELGAFNFDRANWRSEIILGLPLERYAERTRYRAALIDVNRARRSYQETLDRIRAEVRRSINKLRLDEESVEIQRRNLEVSDLRRTYARIQFYDGDIGNRDLIEAENDWTDARNRLNLAKTSRWQSLLDFRLATETLRVEEDGSQPPSEP